MILTPDKYQKSLDYVTSRASRIHPIAYKLMNLLGLNHFVLTHVERNKPKALASLHADVSLSRFWIEQGMPVPLALPNGFYFASQFLSIFPEGVLTTAREKFETDHILFYVQHNRESVDIFSMGADPDNKLILNNYINNVQTMRNFFIYFKQETRSILKEAVHHTFDYDFSIKQQKKSFPGEIIVPDYNGFSSLDDISQTLTKREFECLQLKANSLGLKSIANTLNITMRTVESYLINAKDKLNCCNTNEMIDLYNVLSDP